MDITPKLLREIIKEEKLRADGTLLDTPSSLIEAPVLPGLPHGEELPYSMTMEEFKTQLRGLVKSVDELRGGAKQLGPLFAGIQALVKLADNEGSNLDLQIGRVLKFFQELRKEELDDSDLPRPDEVDSGPNGLQDLDNPNTE
tara:strand:- start:996 stop:1424 length:429 start_codon:yes stop_codon:yes gene_type:complete